MNDLNCFCCNRKFFKQININAYTCDNQECARQYIMVMYDDVTISLEFVIDKYKFIFEYVGVRTMPGFRNDIKETMYVYWLDRHLALIYQGPMLVNPLDTDEKIIDKINMILLLS